MEYVNPTVFVNAKDYDCVISLGNKCISAITLRSLHIYKDSFPFDYIPSNPKLILKYLKDPSDYFPEKNKVMSKDDIWFGHFDTNEKYEETIQKFVRRFHRLFDLLDNKKRILFVYTGEGEIFNELGNRYNDNYTELCNIENYIKERYKYDNFTILAVHTNKFYSNTKNIINYTIKVPEIYLSDDMSTHNDETTGPYRHVLKLLMKEIFQC